MGVARRGRANTACRPGSADRDPWLFPWPTQAPPGGGDQEPHAGNQGPGAQFPEPLGIDVKLHQGSQEGQPGQVSCEGWEGAWEGARAQVAPRRPCFVARRDGRARHAPRRRPTHIVLCHSRSQAGTTAGERAVAPPLGEFVGASRRRRCRGEVIVGGSSCPRDHLPQCPKTVLHSQV